MRPHLSHLCVRNVLLFFADFELLNDVSQQIEQYCENFRKCEQAESRIVGILAQVTSFNPGRTLGTLAVVSCVDP